MFGFQVAEATNGDEAVAAIDAVRPQIILSELTLPLAASLMEKLSRESPMRLIVTTTLENVRVPPQAVGILVKPFALPTMLNEVRRVLTLIYRAAEGTLGKFDHRWLS